MRKSMMMMVILGSVLTLPSLGTAQDTKPASQAAATPKAQAQKKPPSAAQLALQERQKKCAAEWKLAKADGKVENGMKWPQYWSACNKRLKATAM
jgi:hypothetical protein